MVNCCFHLLPSCFSTCHQSNVESAGIFFRKSKISRIRWSNSPCRRRVFVCFLPLGKLDRIQLLVQCQSKFFHELGTVLADKKAIESFLGFAFAFDRLANANTSVFDVRLLVVVARSNLTFNPWKPTHEWELTSFRSSILISTPCLRCS